MEKINRLLEELKQEIERISSSRDTKIEKISEQETDVSVLNHKIRQLIETNKTHNITNAELNARIIELQNKPEPDDESQKLQVEIDSLIEQQVNSQVEHFEKRNLHALSELQDGLKDTKKMIQQINQILDQKQNSALAEFENKHLGPLQTELKEKYEAKLDDYFSKLKINSEIKKYMDAVIRQELNKYEVADFEPLIKFLFDRLAHKYNVLISKEIIKKIPEMSSIQISELKNSIQIVKEKELKYLTETKQGVKALQYLK